jgi:tyrosyl-tRNA synthetase
MASLFGLHEFESRDVIARRMKLGKRVSFHELMYPLMQGYDSVAVKADVELGGIDQKFNLLAGRVIQKAYGQEPQNILMTDILEGTDGRKMSSSWGNTVNLTDSPENMFGKIMSIPDSLIERYFLLATSLPQNEIQKVIKDFKNPRDQKLVLAQNITEAYHSKEKAAKAKEGFISQFSKGELPENIEVRKITPSKDFKLSVLLKEAGLVESKGEARRLIEQNGVKVNGQTVKDIDVKLDGKTEILLQVGKRKYIKLI